MSHIIKSNWLDVAIEIRRFHVQQVKDENNWTIEKTAKLLNRSVGSVSEYLLIAQYCKVFEKEFKKINTFKEAITFIRQKQREHRLGTNDE